MQGGKERFVKPGGLYWQSQNLTASDIISSWNPQGEVMAKTRSFSIYLLKTGVDAASALNADTKLIPCAAARNLPANATMFILDSLPTAPWWKGYFGVEQELTQVHKGAVAFLPVRDRWLALTFGHVAHNLKDGCYEYDFGLRVTLNCVDPLEVRSTDTLEPGVSRRQRTQLPTGSDLTFFDIDKDSSILRGLTGKVKAEYADYFKQATGASSLHISTDAAATGITAICAKLLEIYAKDDYKATFPNIRAIEPVRDPHVVARLEGKLLEALRAKDAALTLTVPDLINYREGLCSSFGGAGRSLLYDDVAMPYYHEYLAERGVSLESVDIKILKKHELRLCNEDGDARESFGVYKCLIFDTTLDVGGSTYHLCDGHWYAVDRDYVAKLKTDLDPHFVATNLMPYDHDDEGEYNEAVGAASADHICLDRTSVAPAGQTAVEPCDLFSVEDDMAVHTHVKISTRSQQLSHLFNQGANAIELIRSDLESRTRLIMLLRERLNGRDEQAYLAPIEADKHCVAYAIATHKPADRRSDNLPLFSRVSLRRCIRLLTLMRVTVRCSYLVDSRAQAAGRARQRPVVAVTGMAATAVAAVPAA